MRDRLEAKIAPGTKAYTTLEGKGFLKGKGDILSLSL